MRPEEGSIKRLGTPTSGPNAICRMPNRRPLARPEACSSVFRPHWVPPPINTTSLSGAGNTQLSRWFGSIGEGQRIATSTRREHTRTCRQTRLGTATEGGAVVRFDQEKPPILGHTTGDLQDLCLWAARDKQAQRMSNHRPSYHPSCARWCEHTHTHTYTHTHTQHTQHTQQEHLIRTRRRNSCGT